MKDADYEPMLISSESSEVQLFDYLDVLRTDKDTVTFVKEVTGAGKEMTVICHVP